MRSGVNGPPGVGRKPFSKSSPGAGHSVGSGSSTFGAVFAYLLPLGPPPPPLKDGTPAAEKEAAEAVVEAEADAGAAKQGSGSSPGESRILGRPRFRFTKTS